MLANYSEYKQFANCTGQFGRVFYATLVRPGSKIEEQVAVKTMKCMLIDKFIILALIVISIVITIIISVFFKLIFLL